jgi:hypothetical protein
VAPILFEIDAWNINSTSNVWVNVPSRSSSNDAVCAYWGNPLVTNLPASSTNGRAWPKFDLVWHWKGSAFRYDDSAKQFPKVSAISRELTNGIVGHGEAFNGKADYLNPRPVNVGNTFTLSAWIKLSRLRGTFKPSGPANPAAGTPQASHCTPTLAIRRMENCS